MSGANPSRHDNIQRAMEALGRAGIAFESRNGGSHLLVSHNGLRVEFAPGTGNWWLNEHNAYRGRGCKELIRFLTERPDSRARAGYWWYGGDAGSPAGLYQVVVIDGAQELTNMLLPGIFRGLRDMPGRWARALNPFTGEAL